MNMSRTATKTLSTKAYASKAQKSYTTVLSVTQFFVLNNPKSVLC